MGDHQHLTVGLVWFVNTRAARDEDNTVATLKPVCDGLVDAGLVPDDTPQWMTKLPARIIYRPKSEGLASVEIHVAPGHPAPIEAATRLLDDHGAELCGCDGCKLAQIVLGQR